MSRLDVWKSLVRSAARASADQVKKLGPIRSVRQAITELRARRATLSEGALSSAIANGVPGVSATTVSLQDGRLIADVGFEDGESLALSIVPEQARFAPRGAKEVIFIVDPPESIEISRAREIVGAVAAAIARALWGPILGPRRPGEAALVEREGARLRADLRSVPAVRSALEGSTIGVALEVISIERFEIAERTLRIVIALPFPPG